MYDYRNITIVSATQAPRIILLLFCSTCMVVGCFCIMHLFLYLHINGISCSSLS